MKSNEVDKKLDLNSEVIRCTVDRGRKKHEMVQVDMAGKRVDELRFRAEVKPLQFLPLIIHRVLPGEQFHSLFLGFNKPFQHRKTWKGSILQFCARAVSEQQ